MYADELLCMKNSDTRTEIKNYINLKLTGLAELLFVIMQRFVGNGANAVNL